MIMGTSGVTITQGNRKSRALGADQAHSSGVSLVLGIGIFAHNEEARLRDTLQSLSRQDLLTQAARLGVCIEITVVANGCTDRTAGVAGQACAEIFADFAGVSAGTVELEAAGKSNAWNEYVHRIAAPEADFLCFMDADIAFVGENALRVMLETLRQSAAADACVDTILKDLAFLSSKNTLQTLSLAVSELTRAGAPKLAGSLYILRGSVARRLWLPIGLLVEDGFLKALLTTDRFTAAEKNTRIVRAVDAAHTFEAERRLLQIFRHEKRLATGTAQNILLFDYLRNQIACGSAKDGCELIRFLNETDPDWLRALTLEGIKNLGWRMLPLELLKLPLLQLQELPANRRRRHLIPCVLRCLFNAVVLAGTYLDLRSGKLRW
ncbi:MAG: glycosyltransferase [Verrucomicrobia bacterium]|nr:glycosyltransferase [Verrucomicrobiota bacterium]